MTNLLTGDTTSFTSGLGTWEEFSNASRFTTAHSTAEGGVMQLTVTNGGVNIAVVSHTNLTSGRPTVSPGQELTVSARTRFTAGAARSHQLLVGFYDASSVLIGSDTIVSGMPVTMTSGWTTISGAVTAPAGAVTCRARLTAIGTVTGDVYLVDDVVIDDGVVPNVPPTANAGADQTVASGAATVTLTGTDSDPDGVIASRQWAQTSGTAVTLSGATTATASFTAPVGPDTLVFSYTVTDDDGATATDSVTVTVGAPASGDGTNLLTGDTATFAASAGTWIKSAGGANFTHAHSTAGGGVLELDVTTGGSNIAVASHQASDATKPAVTAGQTVAFEASCKQVDGVRRNWRVEVNWYGTDKVTPLSGGGNIQVVSGVLDVGSVVTLMGEIVAPAGAGAARMRIWIGAPATGETFHIDNPSVAVLGAGSGGGTSGYLKTYDRVGTSWLLVTENDVSPAPVGPRPLKVRRLNVSAPPSTPDPLITGLLAAAGDGQVGLTWTEPNPSEDVTDYAIDYGTSSAGPWTRYADPVSTVTTVTVPGLTNGTPYWFRVAPVRSGTVGTFSAPVTATPAALPGPSNLRLTAGDAQITALFDPPVPVTGVTDYSIRYRRSTVATWTTLDHPVSTVARRTIGGLVNGVAYVVEVAAVRSGVIGDYTAGPATATPVAPAPSGSIFDEHVGFGNPHLTDPVSIVVTSNTDSGPGTLRAAIVGDAHKHITFAAGLQNAVITVQSVLNPGANTLIDGRGRNITIRGTNSNGAFDLTRWNITLTDFTITDCGNLALTSADDPHDGIIMSGADHIWLHHLDISRCSDKGVGMRQGTKNVTASWLHLHDQTQVFQYGNDFDGEAAGSLGRLTIHHTWWDHTGYRHPVMSYGLTHIYNNLYDDFDLYGHRSQRIAKSYFENNALNCVRNARVTLISGTGGAQKDTRPGYLVAVGNIALPGSLQPSFETAPHDFRPSNYYSYTPDTAGQTLANAIKAGAGPR